MASQQLPTPNGPNTGNNSKPTLLFLPAQQPAKSEGNCVQEFHGPSVSVLNVFGKPGEYSVNVTVPRMGDSSQTGGLASPGFTGIQGIQNPFGFK